ncbi:MAG: hypothetical protein A2161_01565 [Candidatus Schekmanbacteria bacterium RBG_13_48_7]|uniref:Uncharacterized protein n=1 Tax=Candidatus Schekmanbacteria bacterium RBG_13_48_7 TaxID=1817878 RepID=A0A1F7RW53_9BACT|nr:MAG: hypothetical protein A2161_01565 [Candidatus Schekmanbacteria bacterium RBG_13_48_7]
MDLIFACDENPIFEPESRMRNNINLQNSNSSLYLNSLNPDIFYKSDNLPKSLIKKLPGNESNQRAAQLTNLSVVTMENTVRFTFNIDGKFDININEILEQDCLWLQLKMNPVKKGIKMFPELQSILVAGLEIKELKQNNLQILIKMKTDQFDYTFHKDLKRLSINIKAAIDHVD